MVTSYPFILKHESLKNKAILLHNQNILIIIPKKIYNFISSSSINFIFRVPYLSHPIKVLILGLSCPFGLIFLTLWDQYNFSANSLKCRHPNREISTSISMRGECHILELYIFHLWVAGVWRIFRVLNLMTGNCWFTMNSQLPGEPQHQKSHRKRDSDRNHAHFRASLVA